MIYMDNAATMQKSDDFIAATVNFYKNNYASSGRGICARANAVDSAILSARGRVRDFIGAKNNNQIIWTSGATDSLNRAKRIINLSDGPNVMVSDLDHHSAHLPWQESNAKIHICPLNSDNELVFSSKEKIDVFIITAMSNVFGNPQNVKQLIADARRNNPNVITIVDATQYVVHEKTNVSDWDADFVCFSAHKLGGGTGLGVLYIKNPDQWKSDNFGGGTTKDSPEKFEAGTLPLAQIISFPTALDALKSTNLNLYIYDELAKIPQINIISTRNSGLVSFTVSNMHHLDFGALMGANDVCIRVGAMCASWAMEHANVAGLARISASYHNTESEADSVISIIKKIVDKP